MCGRCEWAAPPGEEAVERLRAARRCSGDALTFSPDHHLTEASVRLPVRSDARFPLIYRVAVHLCRSTGLPDGDDQLLRDQAI
jgi:hypothetical protein